MVRSPGRALALEFRILGPLEVVDDGRVLRLGSGKQLGLVAVLLLHANEVVSVDRIVDDLWGAEPPPTAAKIVRNYASLLRKQLGDRLVTQSPGYMLRVEPGELDRDVLERAVADGDSAALTEALALWRGGPLSQFTYDGFAQDEIVRLEELHLVAVERRIDADLEAGGGAQLVGELEGLVQKHPRRERLYERLMLALYRSGRQADALDVYRTAHRTLSDELGIEPGAELRELERRILNQDASLLPARTLAAQAPRRGRGRLAGALLAVALAAAAAIAYLVAQDGAGGLSEITPNHVGAIDPDVGSPPGGRVRMRAG